MRFARILMLDFEEHDFAPEDWRALRALGDELDRCRSSERELHARLAGADCLLVQLGVAVTPALLAVAPHLRYVGVFGTSTGRIDLAGRRDIAVRNVPGFSTEAVAEFAIGIVLEHGRELSAARGRAARGDFSESVQPGRELRGQRFGVLGLGAIGRRVAEIAQRGFGAEVRYWSRTPRPESGFPRLEFDALLASSDVICVHLALTPETRHLLDAGRLARIQDGALLVHLAPPELLDVQALIARLRVGRLRFVTDHADEMDRRDVEALSGLEACTLYPPIGYCTREAQAARRARFIGDLKGFLESDTVRQPG
jgi:phosphoglycerate dehydrogenase-like enzyme